MNMTFKAFARKLFGAGYERLRRALIIDLILFWGLYTAGLKVSVSPFILYLMVSTFTAGVMWQAFSSEDNTAHMQNLIMLPFRRLHLIFSYTAALGVYVLLTKTAALLAVAFAVSGNGLSEAAGSILCAVNAVLMAAVIFSEVPSRPAGFLWAVAVLACILLFGNAPWFLCVVSVNGACAFLLLRHADGYAFYCQSQQGTRLQLRVLSRSQQGVRPQLRVLFRSTTGTGGAVWRYLFRYMNTHRNYFLNTLIMWCIACMLPSFLGTMESISAIPVGLAILTLNTPVCILLSVDPALEQAVRFLPGQKGAFCIPYCLFVFLCNLTAGILFLCSWHLQIGGITVLSMVTAVYIALQSAVFSVLLEWFYPLRDWKIESDLWHHPRKYIVPVIMLLLAGVAGTGPLFLFALFLLLILEISVLLFSCSRR